MPYRLLMIALVIVLALPVQGPLADDRATAETGVDEPETAAQEPDSDADPAPPTGERLFADTPLRLAWFERIAAHPDLGFDLSMETVGWEGIDARGLEAGLRVEGGRVVIDIRRLALGPGRITGQLVVEPGTEPPRVTLSLLANDIDVDDIRMHDAEGLMSDGRLDFRLEFDGQGSTLGELMASANGSLEVLIEDGRARAGSVDEARGPLWMFDVLGVMVPGKLSDVAIRCGVARLKLEDGVLTEEVLAVVTEHTLITGKGRVDFADERVNLVMTPRRSKRFTGVLSPPVRVTGTVAQPRVMIAPFGVLSDPVSLLERLSASVLTPLLALGGGAVHDCATALEGVNGE